MDASRRLVVPLQDVGGQIQTVEFIASDGAKRYLAGAAMDAGNLLPVVEAPRARFPGADLVIVADNAVRPDRDTNPGVETARKAALAVDARVAIPTVPGDAIIDCQATAIIPIRKNGRPWKEACPAARAWNKTLRPTRHYGRAFWKRWTGYHARRRIESKMPSQVSLGPMALDLLDLKAFEERISARDPDRQTAEI